jgi:hypothetical protein
VKRKHLTRQEDPVNFAGGGIFLLPLLIVMATAFLVILPFFFLGNASGHDFEFHVNSWMEVLGQWRQGILYPRWAALAQYAYGEARFIFYPPASWMLGAALGALLPWKAVPGAYVWLALTLSGCSMFLLARRWLDRRDAIFAAAFYAANPYYIVIVYWRSAFAELLAGALLPLLLLYVLRLEEEPEAVVPLGGIVAAAWLTNIPSAVMVNYSLTLLLLILAVLKRSPRVLLQGATAVLFGAALAAFFLVPAAYEQRWVNIAEVLSPGVRPQDNFLFVKINDVDHNRFNLLISLVASAEMIVLAIALFLSRSWRRRHPHLWWTLSGWALLALLLNFSFTAFLWEYLPELRYLQLPWRWLLCVNVAFALFLTMASRRWIVRLLICVAMFAVLTLVWRHVQTPWWDTAADFGEMLAHQQSGAGYEGTDEYVPAGADPYEIKQDAPRVSLEDDGVAPGRVQQIQIQRWGAESKLFSAEVSQPGQLVLRLFNYPAWRVEVNGQVVATSTREVTGQMLIPVQAGENGVQITFTRTWDRTLGVIISGVTAFFVACFVMVMLRRRR